MVLNVSSGWAVLSLGVLTSQPCVTFSLVLFGVHVYVHVHGFDLPS